MADATTFEKEAVDVLELLTLRVNTLSEQNAALLERVNTQSALLHEIGYSDQLDSVQYSMYLQDCQIAELKQSVEDLMAGGVATTQQPPVITDRFKHSKTAKGWRLDESSLTIDWKGGTPNSETRARLLREAYADGLQEEKIRNEEPETLAIS